jgi:predicted transport protein
MEHIRPKTISLRNHPSLNEKWIQDRIAEDPSILGLGDLILKDRERPQPKAGRLDLLLQDSESPRRFEVEVQLGATDESHIIRTIEYWDIERRRYPQYEHCAVLVAEDVTSRFLNVIGLFNGFIPIIVIQIKAVDLDGKVALLFTTVVDKFRLGLVDEDEEVREDTDRSYWESNRGSKDTVALADALLKIVQKFDPECSLKYNKFYIGLAKSGIAYNFVAFRPKKKVTELRLKVPSSQEIDEIIDNAKLSALGYSHNFGEYRINIEPNDLKEKKGVIESLIGLAHQHRVS